MFLFNIEIYKIGFLNYTIKNNAYFKNLVYLVTFSYPKNRITLKTK